MEADWVMSALRDVPAVVDVVYPQLLSSGKPSADVILRLKDGSKLALRLIAISNAWPSILYSRIEGLCADEFGLPVIVSRTFSQEVKSEIERRGLGWIDSAGNCYISHDRLFISISGKRQKRLPKSQTAVFKRTASVSGKALRVLLEAPVRSWSVTGLSEAAGCSIGQASNVKSFLESNGFLEMRPEGFAVTNMKELMQQWAQEYNKKPQTPIGCYSLETPVMLENRIPSLGRGQFYLTGFSGGVRYAPTVRYDRVHAYVMPAALGDVVGKLDLKRVDTGANVFLYPIEDINVLYDAKTIDGIPVVSPVQIFLDCMAIKGRGEEEALAVLGKAILP